MVKFFVALSLILGLDIFAQDFSIIGKENESLPCFGNSKPTRVTKSANFASLPFSIPKYYTSLICLIPGKPEAIIGFFKIPENLPVLFDKNIFDAELKAIDNENLSNPIELGKSIPMIISIQIPSDLTGDSIKEIAKSKFDASESLAKFGNLLGNKKKKSILSTFSSSAPSSKNKRPILLNYKILETAGENVIHLKSEKKENHINFFDLKISFKNSPEASFQIVSFLLLSDLDIYDPSPTGIAKVKKKGSRIEEEIEIKLTKSLLENFPKLLGEQMKIHSKIYGN